MWKLHRTTQTGVDRGPLDQPQPLGARALIRKAHGFRVLRGSTSGSRLICALLLAGAVSGAAAEGPSVQVQVAKAELRTLHETVTAYGRVQPDPDQVASIALPRAGLVGHLWVRLGQLVSADQQLLQLDTAPAARVAYQQAKAAVDYARSDLRRLQDLLTKQLATRDQVASAQKTLQDAEARLQAQSKLGTQLKEEVIRAPFAGIVTQLSVAQGQRVQADTTALLLARRDALVVLLGVEQDDAARMQPGLPVRLSSVFRSDVQVQTQLADVHAMVNPKTRLVDALVPIPKASTANLVIDETMRGVVTLHQERVLAVPRSAVLRDSAGDYLFVVRAGLAHRVAVSTGLEDDGIVAVHGALAAGDAVVTVGNYELSDGMAVREAHP
jgi:RND family efflux transporter MFP subunit